MVRNILKGKNNERLRSKSRQVSEITPRIITLLDDMWETLTEAQGVGLAAPQVGVLRRIVIIEWQGKKYELINPVILEKEGAVIDEEGCLSIPDKWYPVERPERIRAEAMDRNGDVIEYEATGRLARAFVHECEHLDGILVTDNICEKPEKK